MEGAHQYLQSDMNYAGNMWPQSVKIRPQYMLLSMLEICITKTCPCNILNFSKLEKLKIFTRIVFYIFLIFAQNIDCGYTLEPPRRGGSNEYPQSMFWSKNKKNRYTPVYPSFAI